MNYTAAFSYTENPGGYPWMGIFGAYSANAENITFRSDTFENYSFWTADYEGALLIVELYTGYKPGEPLPGPYAISDTGTQDWVSLGVLQNLDEDGNTWWLQQWYCIANLAATSGIGITVTGPSEVDGYYIHQAAEITEVDGETDYVNATFSLISSVNYTTDGGPPPSGPPSLTLAAANPQALYASAMAFPTAETGALNAVSPFTLNWTGTSVGAPYWLGAGEYKFFQNSVVSISLACPIENVGLVGSPYNSALIATGGVPPYTFSIIGGALPPGLSLNASTGVISGIPTTIGAYSYTAQVVDSQGNTATATCMIGVSLGILAPNQIYVLDYRELETAADIASRPPIHISFTGKMICSDLSRKSTHWNVLANCAEILEQPPGLLPTLYIGGGNGDAPGLSPGFASIYWFNPLKYTDDDYGQVDPYYVTYFFINHEMEMALGVDLGRKLFKAFAAYISGVGILQVTPYAASLLNPYPVPPLIPFSAAPIADLGMGLNVTSERVAFKIASIPLVGQTDNTFNLQKFIAWLRKDPIAPRLFGAI